MTREALGRAPACWSTRLSDEQLRFYFLHQLDPADPDLHVERTVRVTGPLDVARLRAAVDDLAARHDVLRSYYPEVDGRPQIWLRDDVDGAVRDAPDAAPFRLDEGPLFRIAVTSTRPGEHAIVLRAHHLVLDGASVRGLLAGLLETYRALGEGHRLERPAPQYRDYVDWEATREVDRPQWRAYWARVLERPAVIDLAAGRPRPAHHTRAASTVHAVASSTLVAALRAACKRHRVTPYLVMMAVFQILLHRVTGQDDVLVATPIAWRPRREFQAMLGVLVRWVAFRTRLRPDTTFAEVLAQIRAAAPDALSRAAPYEALLAAAGSSPRDPARNPVFQVTLNYATLGALPAPPGLQVALDPLASRATPYDLAARFEEVGDTLRLELTYYEGALDRAAAARLADELLGLAERCLAEPDAPVALPTRRVAIAATFTAEPLRPAITYWLGLVQLRAELVIAPIDQVFQTVLAEPATTPLVLLLRADDWKDPLAGAAELRELLAARAGETIVVVCPSRVEDPRFAAALAGVRAEVVPWQAIAARYPVTAIHDPDADPEARAPYTEDFTTALATAIARALYAALRPAPKVLVLDCDQTLWRGIVGEDGVAALVVDADHRALQALAIAQRAAGVLLALASKNHEADVWDAFDEVPGMVLRKDMLAAHRIHWGPKSQSLASIAAELGLGLDAFVFIDDSPAECAEVRAAWPSVTVLQLPAGDLAGYLAHLWPLDPRRLTDTDRKRAELYAADARRAQLRGASPDLPGFIASLEVCIGFVAWDAAVAPRAAQLTQRTNQFTTTALRRTEAELAAMVAGGARVLIAEVSDRFGDYGIVGVAIYRAAAGALEVDNFLLSCRALGRGVEQRMLVELGRIAARAGLGAIELAYRAAPRNQPARLFLDAVASPVTPERYRITAADARAAGDPHVAIGPAAVSAAVPEVVPEVVPDVAPAVWQRIASELSSVPRIRAAIAATRVQPRVAPGAYVAPDGALEARIAAVWAEVIGVDRVGATDDYFALGGDSIRSLAVVSRLRKAGLPASVQALHAHPTVAGLAGALRGRAAPVSAPSLPDATGPYPLSFSQAFVIDAYARENLQRPPSGAFHVQDRLAVRDPRGVAIDALWRAVALQVHRTPLLRTRIFRAAAGWQQHETDAAPAMSTIDLTGQPRPAQDAAIDAVLRDDRLRPFDPAQGGAMIRCYAVVRGAAELELLVTAHHGFCDGWSLHTFYHQLGALYDAYRAGDDARVAAIDGALARHAHGFRALVAREQGASHAAFWRDHARRLGAIAAPSPSPSPPGGPQPQLRATLDRDVLAQASARAAASRTSLKAVLLAAFDLVLARQLGPRVIATVTNSRQDDLAAATDVFGLCWTFVPIACAPVDGRGTPAGSAAEWQRGSIDRVARLAQLHADLLATEAHARHPVAAMFDGVAAAASFNYAHFHQPHGPRPAGGLTLVRGESFHRFHFPLNLNVRRDDDELWVTLSWSEAAHDRRFATELLAAFGAEVARWG